MCLARRTLLVMEINDVNWTGLGLYPWSYSHKHNTLTNCCSSNANCGVKLSPNFLCPPRQTWLESCFHAWLGWGGWQNQCLTTDLTTMAYPAIGSHPQ